MTNSNTRQVTQRDVALHCGISQKAVSLVLHNSARVSAATRRRVLEAMETLGYNPATSLDARRLRLRQSGTRIPTGVIALFVRSDMYAITYYSSIFRGVVAELAGHDHALLTLLGPSGEEAPWTALPPVIEHGDVDGVILIPGVRVENLTGLICASPLLRHRPLVKIAVNEHPEEGNLTSFVQADECQGAYLAMQHLLACGHRHIIHFRGHALNPNFQARVRGVQQAFREAGLAVEEHVHFLSFPMCWVHPTITQQDDLHLHHPQVQLFVTQLRALIECHPGITAIQATNDFSAIRVWRLLHLLGLRVPDDINVLGFDDTDALPDMNGRNLLTSVRLPLEELGRQAVRLLIEQSQAGEWAPREITLPTSLIIRETTGPVPDLA